MASMHSSPPGDQSRGSELLAVLWSFTSVALLVVLLKTYTRFRIIRVMGLDDGLIFFSAILVTICTILFTVDVSYGMGRHVYDLAPKNAVKAVKINYIANPFGIMAYSIPNISVAIFIDRILPLSSMKRALLYSLVISQNIIAAVSCVLLFLQCTPTASLWNPAIMPTSCLSARLLTRYSYFVGSYSAFTDVVLAIVPVMAFRKLQMPVRAKIATSISMSMTAFAAICAIVKTCQLYQLANLSDFTYGTVDLIITAVVEANVIIIAACIPSLRPFVRAVGESVSQRSKIRSLNRSRGSSAPLLGPSWFKLSSIGETTSYTSTDMRPSSSNQERQADKMRSDVMNHDDMTIMKTTDFSIASEQT